MKADLRSLGERGLSLTQLNHFHDLVQTISHISHQDAEIRYRQEAADNQIEDDETIDSNDGDETQDSDSDSESNSTPEPTPARAPAEEKKVISWKINDPDNPHNFSTVWLIYSLPASRVV